MDARFNHLNEGFFLLANICFWSLLVLLVWNERQLVRCSDFRGTLCLLHVAKRLFYYVVYCHVSECLQARPSTRRCLPMYPSWKSGG